MSQQLNLTTAPTPDKPGRWSITEFGPPSVLKWVVFDPLPTPGPSEVLIKILVTGISGADNIQRAGGYPDPRTQKPGFSPGYDFVGRIESLPSSYSNTISANHQTLAPGDLVTSMCIFGAYATHIVLPAAEVIKLRPEDDPVDTTALPLNYMTAYGMLMRSEAAKKLTRGATVLIGSVSGGVGTALAQLVKSLDMGLTMLGTCSAGKMDFVKSLGVIPIDRREADLPGKVRALTGGKGVDVAYDAVGSEQSLKDSLAVTKEREGIVIVIGVMDSIKGDGSGMTRSEQDFNPFTFIASQERMSFWAVTGDYYVRDKEMWLRDFESVLQAVRDGRLKPFIGKLFKLADAVKIHEILVSGAGVQGKMEMIVDAELAQAHGL
jgi:NADPH:quinone reductase